MKKTILFLFVVASVLNNLMAQRNGLVDMGQSKFAKMTNTQLGAVKWLYKQYVYGAMYRHNAVFRLFPE